MIKHLFFTPRLDFKSGWGTLTLNYIKEFKRKNIIVLCSKKNSNYSYEQYDILREPLEYIKNPFLLFVDYFKIKKVLLRYHKDKIYSHFPVEPYSLFLPMLSKFFISNVYYAIGTYSLELQQNYRTKFFFETAKKKFKNVIFFSSFTKKNIEREIDFHSTKLKKIINPIIQTKKERPIRKFKKKTIICVGEIKPRKGYHHLIKVLAKINNYYGKDFNLILIGKSNNKNYQDKLNLLVKKNSLKNHVKFLRNVNEKKLKNYYKKSHIFTMLSTKSGNHFEGFGIVYLEALNYGLPILISMDSGARDLYITEKNIQILKPEKIDKIANEIIKTIKNNKLMNFKILQKHNRKNHLKLKRFYKTLN